MEIEMISITEIKLNPKNPRIIKDDKFHKLVNSIKEFPKMLEIRPIVIDELGYVLGGNMRFKACKEAGLKEVPVIRANDLTEEQKKEFIVKDNANFGDWDWEVLQSEWDLSEIADWGVDVFELPAELDYSILDDLDDDDVNNKVNDKAETNTKAICIPFEKEYYDKTIDIVKKVAKTGQSNLGQLIYDAVKHLK